MGRIVAEGAGLGRVWSGYVMSAYEDEKKSGRSQNFV